MTYLKLNIHNKILTFFLTMKPFDISGICYTAALINYKICKFMFKFERVCQFFLTVIKLNQLMLTQ